MLTLRGVTKTFTTPRSLGQMVRFAPSTMVKVLDGIDLDVAAGEAVAIRGGNGAGKSTLLRLVAGVLVADAGTITLAGVDPATERRRAAAKHNYVPGDDRGLPQRATVRQTLRLFATLRGIGAERIEDEITRNLAVLDAGALADRRVAELSTGQRRRLQLASALFCEAGEVAVLLLDEPTRGLDADTQRRLWDHLRAQRNRGVALLLATHDPEEAEALGARAFSLVDGRLRGDAA